MATKQITRTTKKADAAPAKQATARTVRKAQPTKAQPAKAQAAVSGLAAIKFLSTNRPGAGNYLASYTAAWMNITGFDTGTVLSRVHVLALAGETAVKYHLKQGNFEEVDNGMRISAQGRLHFAGKSDVAVNRNIRPIPEFVEAYKAFFLSGALNANIGLKNETFRKAVSF
jgi:hypothetical protein